jgi:cytochrome oxidase Cu insertion factor (SCO1/SenC/PrrC family)
VRTIALLAALFAAPALAHHVELLPALEFEPPAPGTYVLHRIMPAPEGHVLGLSGKVEPLSRYTRGTITLLGFIYTTCADPDGCPLAYRVFDALKEVIEATPRLHGKVQFVTLSFDPARDTPDVMRDYAGSRAVDKGSGLRWYFLTTRSARELMPLVEGFGQDVTSTARPGAHRELSHVKGFRSTRRRRARDLQPTSSTRTVLNHQTRSWKRGSQPSRRRNQVTTRLRSAT